MNEENGGRVQPIKTSIADRTFGIFPARRHPEDFRQLRELAFVEAFGLTEAAPFPPDQPRSEPSQTLKPERPIYRPKASP